MKDNGILENVKMECGRYFHRIGGFRRDFSGMARDCGPDGLLFASGGFAAGGIQLSFELSQRAQTESAVGNGFGNRSGAGIGGAFGSSQGGSDHWLIPMVMGAVFAVNGAVKLQRSLELKQVQYRGWGIVMFYAILTIGFGVLLLFNPFSAATMMVRILGIGLLVSGGIGHYNHDECFPADSEDMLPGVAGSKKDSS